MKRLLLLLLIICGLLISQHLQAQMTSGGSQDRWKEYSLYTDTIIKEVPIEMEPTSASYFRISRATGRGLMADPNIGNAPGDFPFPLFEYPQNGFKGNAGNDLDRGFEMSIGIYENWDNINKNLHPGIDFSGYADFGFQHISRNYENEIDWYNVDYGNYFGLWTGYGIVSTLKPFILFEEIDVTPSHQLLIDIGFRADLLFYGSGTSSIEVDDVYFSSDPSRLYDYKREIIFEMFGMRIDRVFSIGIRYSFIGIRWETSGILANVVRPEYEIIDSYSPKNFFGVTEYDDIEMFEEEIDYSFSKIGIQFFF